MNSVHGSWIGVGPKLMRLRAAEHLPWDGSTSSPRRLSTMTNQKSHGEQQFTSTSRCHVQ
eukprot:5763148-Amphidinium_carterae.1